jgi:excisionase family DNA binding protein
MSNASPAIDLDNWDPMTLDEVAELFGVSKRTVQELVTARALPSYKIRKNRRVNRADAVAYLASVRV